VSIVYIVGYFVAAGVTGLILRRVNSDDPLNFFFALMWPITLYALFYYTLSQPTGYPYTSNQESGGPFARWKRAAPKGGNEEMIIGEGREQNVEDMAAFIDTLASRPDMPLPHELTFSNKLTGISKTYPAGTTFPSALVNDWKRGYFMSKETVEETES
jgi:hypothetical protein